MSWIGNLLGGGIKEVISGIGGVLDNLTTSKEEKMQAELAMQKLILDYEAKLEESLMTELQAKERVLVAELNQGDTFTKRARPMVIYFGLFVIFYNYCVVPTIQFFNGLAPAGFDLPAEFWFAWGGIVGTYAIGRTMEKRSGGTEKKSISLLTGATLKK